LRTPLPPAPISGRIGRALVTEGALVGKGEATHLATIEQLDPIRVEFSQSYSDLLRLQQAVKAGKQKQADAAKVEMVLEDGTLLSGKGTPPVHRSGGGPQHRRGSLRAEFPNPRREFCPAPSFACASPRPRSTRDPRTATRGAGWSRRVSSS
jgi:membrane fusion protein (multidrug efflux system)